MSIDRSESVDQYTLAAILLIGMLASSLAVVGALRTPLLPALKAE